MANQAHDIIVFGAGGDWLSKNKAALKRRFHNPHFVGEGDWKKQSAETKAPIALIMTPPQTHREICEALVRNSMVQDIYCEKPFSDIDSLFLEDCDASERQKFHDKIKVVDHYLLKTAQVKITDYDIPLGENKTWRLAQRYLGRWCFRPGAYNPILSNSYAKGTEYFNHTLVYFMTFMFRFFTYFTGWVPVKYIEIDIKEKQDETRPWMKEEDIYGGVINDLGHHALAITLRLFGAKELRNVTGKDITIIKTRHFDNKPEKSFSEISFLVKLPRCTIRINVAKSAINTSKKISLYRKFMTHAAPNKVYGLEQGVLTAQKKGYDYAENFDNGASCLTYDDVHIINQICRRVTNLAHHKKIKNVASDLDDIELIHNLTDQFKHRHGFYWQYYYKLVIYQVIILLTPYAFALNFAKNTEPSQTLQHGPGITIFILTIFISLWIYYWGVQKVTAVLAEEHIRMKVVHDNLKSLLNKTKIDLSVISINDSSISDVMLTQYRFLVRGLCLINPIVIYFMFENNIKSLF